MRKISYKQWKVYLVISLTLFTFIIYNKVNKVVGFNLEIFEYLIFFNLLYVIYLGGKKRKF